MLAVQIPDLPLLLPFGLPKLRKDSHEPVLLT